MAVGELERLFGGSGSRPKNWTLLPVGLLGLLLLLVVLLLSRKNTPAPMESLHALPHDRHDGSLSWAECWDVAELSHPAFCSARELMARAALWGGHALDVVEGLTVRMQRVRVERLLLLLPVCRLRRREGLANAFLPIPPLFWRSLFRALLLKLWTGPVPSLLCLLLWQWMMVSTLTSRLSVRPTAHASWKHDQDMGAGGRQFVRVAF